MLPTEGERKEHCLTRGVFPTAPVKPFTEYDVKLLKGTDFNTAALDGIMVVGGKKTAKQIKIPLTNCKVFRSRPQVRLAFLHNLYIRHVHGLHSSAVNEK